MLKFRILDNHTGIITTRQPREVHGDVKITFIDAPDNATAVFKTKDADYYRELDKGTCVLPAKDIKGAVKVSLGILDGSGEAWICEGIEVRHLPSGTVFIAPDDTDMAHKIVELKLENQALRKENLAILDRIAYLDIRLEHLYEGYDIT
jgi:hypothetical protein